VGAEITIPSIGNSIASSEETSDSITSTGASDKQFGSFWATPKCAMASPREEKGSA